MTRVLGLLLLAVSLLGASVAAGAGTNPWTKACGVGASCFATPDGCLARGNCVAVVSVAKQDGSNTYNFEMESVGGAYVAVGVSKDARMGDTSVVECVHNNIDGVRLFTSYNLPGVHSNVRIPLVDGVQFVNGSFADRRLRCSFTRAAVTHVEGNLFDLNNNEYHLLLAVGSHVSVSPPKLAYHDVTRAASKRARNLGVVGMFV